MIDLQLDPFSPAHEADLARVGEELAPDAGVGQRHLRVVLGWQALSPIDPWYPTAWERRKGLLRLARTGGRAQAGFEHLRSGGGPGQDEVDELRRHCGGAPGSAAHDHWRALVVPPAMPSTPQAPPVPVLTDQDLVVLVRRTAGEMADAKDRLAALEAGARPTSPLAPVRSIGSSFAKMGKTMGSIARGELATDLLVIRTKAPLAGSRVAPLAAVTSVDHLRWRFADGSWLDVQLPHSDPAAGREVLRRIEAAGVPVDPEAPFLLAP